VRLKSFFRCESGAVTTDWVVLTAATAGLGLATLTVATGGVFTLSTGIGDHLAGVEIASAFDTVFEAVELAFNSFEGGDRGDWTGGEVRDLGGELGEMLQVGRDQIAELAFSVPAGAAQAVLSFDLFGIDSLDHESATITINGQTVSIATGNHGALSFANSDLPGITVESTIHSQNTQMGGSNRSDWLESASTVTITLANPSDVVTLGVASGTNQHVSDESFGIDNVVITAQ